MPVPPDVPVLALQHQQDVVPRLDGRDDPDRRSWVTVTRDLADDPDVRGSAVATHRGSEYVETAVEVDRSADQSLQAWRGEHRPFFEPSPGRDPVIRDFRIERAQAVPRT